MKYHRITTEKCRLLMYRLWRYGGYINERTHTITWKAKSKLDFDFSIYLAELFFHERVYNLQTQLKRYKNNTTLMTQ